MKPSNHKLNHFVLATVFIAISVLFTINLHVEAKSCHLRELDLCLASVLVFAQSTNKITESEINKQCTYFGDTERCVSNYTSSCATKSQELLIDFASDGVLKTFKEYCTPGHNIRRLFLKHGDCLTLQRPKANKCLIDLQAAIEKTTQDSKQWRDRPRVLCCAYDRYRSCMQDVLEPTCGKEAVELGEVFVRSIFSRALQVTCSKYRHTSNQCRTLLPPKGTLPKGPRSTSVISRLMSTVTGIQ